MNRSDLNVGVGDKALVTVDNWFYAPDGRQYRAVFGTVRAVRTAEDSLGVKPNGRSTNWYMEIGNLTVAGCQVHYSVRTDTCNALNVEDWITTPGADGQAQRYIRPCSVYFADPEADA